MPCRRPIAVAVVVAAALLGSGTPVLGAGRRAVRRRRPRPRRPPRPCPRGSTSATAVTRAGPTPSRTPPRSSPPTPTTSTRCCTSAPRRPRPAGTPCGPSWTRCWPTSTGSKPMSRRSTSCSADLVVQQRIVARRAVAARQQMVERAVGAYVAGNAPEIEAAYGAIEPNEVEERRTIVSTIMEADRDEAERLLARRLDVTARLSRVLEQAEQTEAELRVVRTEMAPLRVRLEAAELRPPGPGGGQSRSSSPASSSRWPTPTRSPARSVLPAPAGGPTRAPTSSPRWDTAGGLGAGCHRQRRHRHARRHQALGHTARAGRSTTTPTSRPTPTGVDDGTLGRGG